MKKTITLLVAILILSSCFRIRQKTTYLRIKNSNPTDTVLVYLTLSSGEGWVSNVNGIFGIVSEDALQGSFLLAPNDSLTYKTPRGLSISGNISFGFAPVNCPTGITVYEFTLNNLGTVPYAQETAEISCVAGVNSLGKIYLYDGGNWEADQNYLNVREIHNDSMGKNTGLVGVFPYGCTNCTDTNGMPSCVTNPETPQSQSICNISRDAKRNGGVVKIEFKGLINN